MPNPKRITNAHIPTYVGVRVPFQAPNAYARYRDDEYGRRYIVYSYRDTWPLLVYDENTQVWYENTDRVSRTTSKHLTLAKRAVAGTVVQVNVDDLIKIVNYGPVGIVMASNERIKKEEFEDVMF